MPEWDGLTTVPAALGYHEKLSNSRALLAALELHDPDTARHARNTVRLADAVAAHMGLTPPERLEVRLVAMLHDIGKIGLPDRILNNPGRLTPKERVVVNRHPGAGADVVAGIDELAHLAPAICSWESDRSSASTRAARWSSGSAAGDSPRGGQAPEPCAGPAETGVGYHPSWLQDR